VPTAAPIQNIRRFPHKQGKFIWCRALHDAVNRKIMEIYDHKMMKYQLQLQDTEKAAWQDFANQHFRGNLARMIRTLVTHGMVNGFETSQVPEELTQTIGSVLEDTSRTRDKVDSFDNDLTIIKSLLSQLLQKESPVIHHMQTDFSVPLEEIIRHRVREYLLEKERAVSVEEMLSFLNETSVEARRWLAQEDSKLPAGGKIALAFIVEDTLKQLFEETGNERFNVQEATWWERYDF